MKKSFFTLTFLVLIFMACKKENKTVPETATNNNPPASPAVDFTITASNINYLVGTTWSYSLTTIDYQYVNISSANPTLTYSYTTNATFTVSVVRDTIISPNITGKILLTSAPGIDNVNTYIREVVYYDSADLKWHDIAYEKYNGGSEYVGCLGITLPLTPTSAWQNTHASHLSSGIDSCFALGFDNAACGLGSIKSIKFQSKTINDHTNTYWYNNTYGKVRTESVDYQTSGQTLTGKTSTMTLTSYHN